MAGSVSVAWAVQAVGRPVFTSREIALLAGRSVSATTHALTRMAQEDLIRRVAHGLWCNTADPRFSPFLLVPFLAGTHQAYVSFLSALHLHGMIEQIPQTVYAATTGHTRVKKTSLGTYSLHRIHPKFFAGFDWYRGGRDFLIASPEKALVDSLYLSSRRGKRFGFFPELELREGFRLREAVRWAERIPYPRIQTYVLEQLSVLKKRYRLRGAARA